MYRTFAKKIGLTLLFCVFLNTSAFAEKSWYTIFVENPLPFLTAGTITTLILGKIAYNYYQTHWETHEQLIEYCRSAYKQMHDDVQSYHHSYANDVKLSDWELKEMILENSKKLYPFMTYYASLTRATWRLKKHLATINAQLKKINNHKRQFFYTDKTERTIHLEKMLLQLEMRGKYLHNYITKTMCLVSTLKKRIKLFREYNEDCCNWSQNPKI